ncbi:MAG: PTPA-CTERM sorting domain-containing protein [Alkalinema sp. RL_2_19]|nr:PTPA-CTERM sorting domain-containing protein [Alkalinema sp. RL_2_19]
MQTNFSIKFTNPLAAFGFWGTDLGDSKNTLTVVLKNAGVQVGSQLIDYLDANAGDSSVFFFGGIATGTAELFDEVQLISSINSTGDAIGIDQITVGTADQVTATADPVTPVPTPAMLPGLIGVGMAARRKRQQQAV